MRTNYVICVVLLKIKISKNFLFLIRAKNKTHACIDLKRGCQIATNEPSLVETKQNKLNEIIQMAEIKSFLYAWLGKQNKTPTYEIATHYGEANRITFKCVVINLVLSII